jgi:23S rRNA (cytosine1962-C5)-methyltransferase
MSNHPLPELILLPGKEVSLLRFHRWIFSGAVKSTKGQPEDGSLCRIISSKGQLLATAHFNQGSIVARILDFGSIDNLKDFYQRKLKLAFDARRGIGFPSKGTNIFRLIHGEGDGLPGLIIDVYGDTAVLQAHSVGMFLNKDLLAEALIESSGGLVKNVYAKCKESLPNSYTTDYKDDFLIGGPSKKVLLENGIKFSIDIENGQKTGFFIDQRDNRELLGKYAKGRKVLNTFCYTGGFSLYALQNDAAMVTSVDSSKRAMVGLELNLELNKFINKNHISRTADVMDFIKKEEFEFDLVVLDPPAFAKNIKNKHNALQAYKRLNESAIRQIASGGILFTFSCSQVVDSASFEGAVRSAAIEVGRSVRILHRLRQPADHPVSIYHPEGEYLKGLVLWVE